LAWSTEKHVTPATAPPLMTQAVMLVEKPNGGCLHTSLQLRGVCNRGRELSYSRSGVDETRVGRVGFIDCEHRNGIATRIDGEEVLLQNEY
jgi:hypothetical protein